MNNRSQLHIRLLIVNVIILFTFTGCATKQLKLTETGFLSSYVDLEADEESKGMYVYKNPDVKIADRYNKILIAPVVFKLDPTVKEHEMKDADREKLSDYFVEKLEDGLAQNYTITDQPGEDVLLFRTAITDILPRSEERRVGKECRSRWSSYH